MRKIAVKEKQKRGCRLCTDVTSRRENGKKRTMCPHTECPYGVLDKYETYEDYMQSEDSKIYIMPVGHGAGARMTQGAIDKYGRRLLRTALGGGFFTGN